MPALQLDEEEILTEVAVILQYLADQKPESGLAPKLGTKERYRLMEWLNFISSELHKLFGSLFNPKIPVEWRETQLERLGQRFDYLTHQLNGKPYLTGDSFTVADAYLFTILNWSALLKVDLKKWSRLQDYLTQVAARPSVGEAMRA
ncbi:MULTISPECIES: glutathione binding-like protein [Methylomicrobium]|uniref:glutathione binding-like protein n=1 Tax=Methylomicrobium TaxID=39773 RepID=UPI00020D88BD|nr:MULTISPECIES: glutathione binding-like protein [Methylomicrobium]